MHLEDSPTFLLRKREHSSHGFYARKLTSPESQSHSPFPMVSGLCGSCTSSPQRAQHTISCMLPTFILRWMFQLYNVRFKRSFSAILFLRPRMPWRAL